MIQTRFDDYIRVLGRVDRNRWFQWVVRVRGHPDVILHKRVGWFRHFGAERSVGFDNRLLGLAPKQHQEIQCESGHIPLHVLSHDLFCPLQTTSRQAIANESLLLEEMSGMAIVEAKTCDL